MAFQRTDGGRTQVFLSSALDLMATISARRITGFHADTADPAVSPNGQEIAFSVGTGADCSLWLADQSGNAQRQLTDQTAGLGCDDQPAWSPDGNFIAFRRTRIDASGRELAVTYMMVPAGGGAPQPLNLPTAISGFNWAPGKKLVFVSPGGPKRLSSLQTANANGSGDRTILRAPGLTGRPAWSPDGDTIAFAKRMSDGRTDIATVPTSGGRVTDITDTPRTSESDPVWAVPMALTSPGSSGTPLHVISNPPRRRRRRR